MYYQWEWCWLILDNIKSFLPGEKNSKKSGNVHSMLRLLYRCRPLLTQPPSLHLHMSLLRDQPFSPVQTSHPTFPSGPSNIFPQSQMQSLDTIWAHPSLRSLEEAVETVLELGNSDPVLSNSERHHIQDDLEDDNDMINTGKESGRTNCERFEGHIQTLWQFLDGCDYQMQFADGRMLDAFEREAGPLLWLAESCLMKEQQLGIPTTWGRSSASVMWYRPRPQWHDERVEGGVNSWIRDLSYILVIRHYYATDLNS